MQTPEGSQYLLTDNFYTSNEFERCISYISDRNFLLIGTMRINYIEVDTKPKIQEDMKCLKNAERNSWLLVRARHRKQNYSSRRHERHASRHSLLRLNASITAGKNDDSDWDITPHSGYIIWKESKIVSIFTNDLADAQSADFLGDKEDETKRCVCGFASIRRCNGDDIMHRRELRGPKCLGAYNLFMNGIDKLDQLRSTSPTMRREKD